MFLPPGPVQDRCIVEFSGDYNYLVLIVIYILGTDPPDPGFGNTRMYGATSIFNKFSPLSLRCEGLRCKVSYAYPALRRKNNATDFLQHKLNGPRFLRQRSI